MPQEDYRLPAIQERVCFKATQANLKFQRRVLNMSAHETKQLFSPSAAIVTAICLPLFLVVGLLISLFSSQLRAEVAALAKVIWHGLGFGGTASAQRRAHSHPQYQS
jgi:hypothetical protein